MDSKLLDIYFAGLIDGEGCIGIYPDRANGGVLRPKIKVNMTCHKTIQALATHFGGTANPRKVPAGNKPVWEWQLTFQKAITVIKRVQPYLITKSQHAEYVLTAYEPKYQK